GSAHIVGLVTVDGDPFATRSWGIQFSDDRRSARILLGTTELAALGYPDGDVRGVQLAITSTEIITFRSAQLKGAIEAIEPITETDLEVFAAYRERMFAAVLEVDRMPPEMMQHMVPDDMVACRFSIAEAYDQTPGPGAGRPFGT